jgi:RHS repeat-associated protein
LATGPRPSARRSHNDANGNLTADGTRTFEWDARNQLVAVTVGTHRSEFTYDGKQRQVRVVEKENSVVQSDTQVVWCDEQIREERAADGLTVTRRALSLGEQVGGVARYFTMDHLESVGEVTDNPVGLLARYAFDPWGNRTVISGADVTSVGFAGLRVHVASATALGLYRGYDAGLARWLSTDPLGDVDGPNRYAYVGNNPVTRVDPLGLQWSWTMPGTKKKLKDGIEAAWLSCLNKGDRRVYWKETPFNPLVRMEEWRKWRKDFADGCRQNPSPGYSRYSTCSTAEGYGGGAGFCVCCEGCT